MRQALLLLVLTASLCSGCAGQVFSMTPVASPSAPVVATASPSASPSPLPVTPAEQATPTANATATGLAAPWHENAVYESTLRPPAAQGLDVAGMTEYHLAVTLAGDLSRLEGSARIRYTNRTQIPLEEIYLHLYPNLWNGHMTIASVTVGGMPVTATLLTEDTIARIPLPSPLAPGRALELALRFAEPIPAGTESANYGEFAFQDGVLAMAGFYPTLVVFDGQGWHLEVPASYGDVLYANASLYDVTLTAPAGLVVAATGATAARRENADGTVTWRLVGGPLRDFNVVASADYRSASQQVGDVTVNSYFLEKDKNAGQQALAWASAALADYQTAFGPYPYRELDVAETPTTAGGIEYPGLVVIGEALYRDARRQDFFEAATAHEVAHQWWYNAVGDDQVNQPWLDEALAQYSTLLYFQQAHGEAGRQGFLASLNERWARVNRADKPVGLPVADYNVTEYSAIVYGRGPLFLVALHDQIGDRAMTEFLQRYYRQYTWMIATTDAFKALAEQVSGQDLTPLFRTWVYPK